MLVDAKCHIIFGVSVCVSSKIKYFRLNSHQGWGIVGYLGNAEGDGLRFSGSNRRT